MAGGEVGGEVEAWDGCERLSKEQSEDRARPFEAQGKRAVPIREIACGIVGIRRVEEGLRI